MHFSIYSILSTSLCYPTFINNVLKYIQEQKCQMFTIAVAVAALILLTGLFRGTFSR